MNLGVQIIYKMTTSNSWYEVQPDASYTFELMRGTLSSVAGTETTLGAFLKTGLAHIAYVEELERRHGFEEAASYLSERSFTKKVATRVGDFGEVISGRLLEAQEGLTRPVEKARYKDNHDWPVRLTDIFCIEKASGAVVSLVFCETKTRTTKPPSDLATNVYKELAATSNQEQPEVLFFTLEHLVLEGKLAEYTQLDDALRGSDPLPRLFRMVLIFDDETWISDLFSDLDAKRKTGEVDDIEHFLVYSLTRTDLRAFIERAYASAENT